MHSLISSDSLITETLIRLFSLKITNADLDASHLSSAAHNLSVQSATEHHGGSEQEAHISSSRCLLLITSGCIWSRYLHSEACEWVTEWVESRLRSRDLWRKRRSLWRLLCWITSDKSLSSGVIPYWVMFLQTNHEHTQEVLIQTMTRVWKEKEHVKKKKTNFPVLCSFTQLNPFLLIKHLNVSLGDVLTSWWMCHGRS